MSRQKLQQSQLHQQTKNLLNTIEKMSQTQRKVKNLFYIKSKHTKKYFNNHPYFRSSTQMDECDRQVHQQNQQQNIKQRRIPIINQQRLKTASNLESSKKFPKRHHTQFVGLPTQYGIENTYKFMQQKSFLGKINNLQTGQKLKTNRYSTSLERSKRMSLKYSNFDNIPQNFSQNGKNYMRATAAYESRLFNTVEERRAKCLTVGLDEQKNIGATNSLQKLHPNKLNFNVTQRRASLSVTKQPQLHQSKLTQDQKHMIQSNVIYNNPMVRRPSINLNNLPASHQVKFLYGKRLKSVHEIPYRFITFDIFPSIIATFLKCKIHYKDMNQAQYNFVSTQIKRVLKENKKKEKYDIKDIVNISTIKELMNFMKQYSDQDFQATEIIRYFFLLNDQKVLDYHLQKVKQSVANFIAIKFDAEFGKKELFLFDLETKSEVNKFYDLLKGQKFLIGDDPNVMNDYLSLQNKQTENQHMESKIKKWKSIAQCQTLTSAKNSHLQNPTESIRKQSSRKSSQSKIDPLTSGRKLSDEKFNLIFEQFKIRQQKRMSKHINLGDSRSIQHKSRESFVQRSRLKKEQDFFQ